ncbi:MAG: trimethylamine methyltransferase family protein [Anaerolineae bacterium]
MLLGAGLLHGSRILSYEQMVMDCEIFSIVRSMMNGIVVNDETLALDVIRSVGPGGNFLKHKHTRAHMQELAARLMDRRPYGQWEAKRDGARDWARERAQHILREHQPDRGIEVGRRVESYHLDTRKINREGAKNAKFQYYFASLWFSKGRHYATKTGIA